MADFESFRQKFSPKPSPSPAPAAPALVVNHGREPYQAFDTKDKLKRLDLRANDGLSHALPYSHLLLLSYDRRNYGEIFLTISGMAATVKGINLKPIVDALKLHTCEYIQSYDPKEFAQPTDKDAPFVELVDVEIIRPVAAPVQGAKGGRK